MAGTKNCTKRYGRFFFAPMSFKFFYVPSRNPVSTEAEVARRQGRGVCDEETSQMTLLNRGFPGVADVAYRADRHSNSRQFWIFCVPLRKRAGTPWRPR